MSILITGANGFLGNYLAGRFHAQGTKVVGLDVAAGSPDNPWPVVVGDVQDRELVQMVFAEHEVETVLHGGGISGPHVCNDDPRRVFDVNVLGTLNILEAAKEHSIGGRVVFFSSSSAYGQAAEAASLRSPLLEDRVLLASEPYGASKVACEAILRAYIEQQTIQGVSLRISIVYGANRTTYCGITEILRSALAGKPILLNRDNDSPLPWVYIDDVCDAVAASLAPSAKLENSGTYAFNITGPGYPTFKEMARFVQELVPGATVKESNEPDKYAMNARKMSLDAARRDLGWSPRVSISDGIERLHDALVKGN